MALIAQTSDFRPACGCVAREVLARHARTHSKIGPFANARKMKAKENACQSLTLKGIVECFPKDENMTKKLASAAPELDLIAWKILEALQQNARMTFAELGRKVGLSTPAVAERVHRLEESGIITGYHAAVDPGRLGMTVRVVVRLTIRGGDLQVSRAVSVIRDLPEVMRCHRVTGDESFVMEANVVSIRHLEALIDKLGAVGETSTSTVLSSPVERRIMRRRDVEVLIERH